MDLNQVTLSGRVSSLVPERTLPSGDRVLTFRMVIARPPRARRGSRQGVDTIDCDAWTATLRRKVGRLSVGQNVTVEGRLRRQFSRSAAGPTSRVTVDVSSVAVLSGLGSNP